MESLLWYIFSVIFYFAKITAYPDVILEGKTLKAVNLFCRHGARTPLTSNEVGTSFYRKHWSEPPGFLTKVGKQKMFELGNVLREKYADFLSPYYFPGEIFASSTPLERTKDSVKALLAGLYNNQGYKYWSDKIPVPLVPVVIDDNLIDKSSIVNSPNACPVFKSDQKISIHRAMAKDEGFQTVYKYLKIYTGKEVNGLFDIFPIWDVLECLAHNNRNLPSWASPVYPEKMSQIMARVFRALIVGTERMVRLTAGPYIRELHKQFTEASENSQSRRKFIIHGGHDFSMTANLGGLGTFGKIVNPGNAIILELHEVPFAGFFVQMFYAEAGGSDLSIMKIGDCGQPCPLHLFIELTKDVIPINWTKECSTN